MIYWPGAPAMGFFTPSLARRASSLALWASTSFAKSSRAYNHGVTPNYLPRLQIRLEAGQAGSRRQKGQMSQVRQYVYHARSCRGGGTATPGQDSRQQSEEGRHQESDCAQACPEKTH